MTAECVRECSHEALSCEAHLMMERAGRVMSLGDCVGFNVAPRWIYHSTDAIEGLSALRRAFAGKLGDGFVPGAWEPYAKGEKFAELSVALAASLDASGRTAAAA